MIVRASSLGNTLANLKTFISLSINDAIKRDELEEFLDGTSKALLLDADSLLFNVAHFHIDKDTTQDEQFEDLMSQVRAIVNRIEDDGVDIYEVFYFFTTCKNNFRKELLPTYKANRPKNPTVDFVNEFKKYVIKELVNNNDAVYTSDTLEADDLIGNLHHYEASVVCSIDKDLKQLHGAHFDYYKVKTGEVDEYGDDIKEYRGWSYTTEQEGYDFLLKQLLIGDTSDNIKGAKGIGKVKAGKLLEDKNNFGKLRAVFEAYNDKERLKTNIKLMKL